MLIQALGSPSLWCAPHSWSALLTGASCKRKAEGAGGRRTRRSGGGNLVNSSSAMRASRNHMSATRTSLLATVPRGLSWQGRIEFVGVATGLSSLLGNGDGPAVALSCSTVFASGSTSLSSSCGSGGGTASCGNGAGPPTCAFCSTIFAADSAGLSSCCGRGAGTAAGLSGNATCDNSSKVVAGFAASKQDTGFSQVCPCTAGALGDSTLAAMARALGEEDLTPVRGGAAGSRGATLDACTTERRVAGEAGRGG